MLNAISQTQKESYHMVSLTCGNKQNKRKTDSDTGEKLGDYQMGGQWAVGKIDKWD